MNVTDPKVAQMLQSYLAGGAGRRQWDLPQQVSGPQFSPMSGGAPEAGEGAGMEGFAALAGGLIDRIEQQDMPSEHGYGQTQAPAQPPQMELPPPPAGAAPPAPQGPPAGPLQAPPPVQSGPLGADIGAQVQPDGQITSALSAPTGAGMFQQPDISGLGPRFQAALAMAGLL